jgi:phosphatidate cytidylyltransferase
MLKQRLLTALILIPLIVWSILFLDTTIIAIILAIFICLGAWEWGNLSKFKSLGARILYTDLVILSLILSFIWLNEILSYLLIISTVWWIFALLWVIAYQLGKLKNINIVKNSIFMGFIGLIILIPTWAAMVSLHANPHFGAQSVLFLLILIWTADSAAYFAGRRWGRRKLASKVSPGKSIEGVLGALFMSVIVAIIYMKLQNVPTSGIVIFAIFSIFIVLVSILGDLTESLFKRQANIKDSGQILPGHGGILDRIDSLTAATPLFVFILYHFI